MEKRNPYTIENKDIENARLGYWDEEEYPDDDEYEYAERYGYGYGRCRRNYDEDYDLPSIRRDD